MQFKIHGSFEVFIAKSRCFPGTGGNTASCNCQTLLWHRLAEKQLRASQFSRKDITQLTMLKMQYRHDHLLQLIGMFIMGDKRQWQGKWIKVRDAEYLCVCVCVCECVYTAGHTVVTDTGSSNNCSLLIWNNTHISWSISVKIPLLVNFAKH